MNTSRSWLLLLLVFGLMALAAVRPAAGHEGHDHDKPPPLNLPVAPRVIAVTPELELVGVLSGREQLTIFLHEFATNTPVAGARMTVSAGDTSVEAQAEGDGVFTVAVPWISQGAAADIIFALTLADGAQDLLTGRLEVPQSLAPAAVAPGMAGEATQLLADTRLLWMVGGAFAAGVLLTLLLVGGQRRGTPEVAPAPGLLQGRSEDDVGEQGTRGVRPLRRAASASATALVLLSFAAGNDAASAEEARAAKLPSVPSTMATDQPQRMPDATLFIPKATQHLLSIRTQMTARSKAAQAVELSGRVTVGPKNLGRVQSNRPGRFLAAGDQVGYLGLRVNAGQVLGYVETYIEAADRAGIASQIAETEARIAKNRTILSRYESSPGAVPQVRIDEVRGELQALTKRRDELLPSTSAREALVAPISGVISAAQVVVGQVVEPRDVLFEIIDPSEFRIEAVSTASGVAERITSAVATLGDGEVVDLEYLGRGLALRNNSSVLNFRIVTQSRELAVGMTARIVLKLEDQVEGFVLPASAVVRGATGLPIVWLKSAPERFEPQVVAVIPFDGKQVVVTAGLKDEQRIVTEGVTLLNQVR